MNAIKNTPRFARFAMLALTATSVFAGCIVDDADDKHAEPDDVTAITVGALTEASDEVG